MSSGNQSRGIGIGAFWFVVLAGGCVGFGPGGRFNLSLSDPPSRSPYLTPLDAPSSQTVARLGPEYRPQLDAPDPEPTLANRNSLIPATPNDRPSAAEPEPVEDRATWDVTHSVPDTAAIDELFLIRLRIKNTAAAAAENVDVTVQFNEAWRFPGSAEHAVRQSLGRVEPDESRELAVSLTPVRSGRQCVDVVIQVDGETVETSTICTMVQQRLVNVEIAGPTERTVGGRAEYVVTLTNLAGRKLPGVVATLNYDPPLTLKEVSAGAVLAPGRMTWSLGELRVDERVQIQVEFSCDAPTNRACLTAVVQGEDFSELRAESCLSVAAVGRIAVEVSDESDPAELSDEVVYQITLRNLASSPASGIVLQLTPTEQMTVVGVDGRTAAGPLTMWATEEEGSTRVEPTGVLSPGQIWTLRVRTRMQAPGVGQMIVLVNAGPLTEPVVVREFTVVNPRPVP